MRHPFKHGRPEVLSLFAGPGGWCEAMRAVAPFLAPRMFGLEWDPTVCATRRAAGHRTGQADVAKLGPGIFGNVRGLISSSPCQTMSNGGKKSALPDFQHILDTYTDIGWGVVSGKDHPPGAGCGCAVEHLPDLVADRRTALVVEPLRWAFALRPEWIVLEQVPAAEALWEDVATELMCLGYQGVDFGVVDAADFGVPQHRKRAVLIANAYEPVRLPTATHGPAGGLQAYRTPASELGLRGTLGFARRNDRPDGGKYRARDMRTTERPAFTVTEKVRSWTYVPDDGQPRQLTMGEISQLQTFRPDYPWAGSRTVQCLQVANAVPPRLGAALIRGAMGRAAARTDHGLLPSGQLSLAG
jgi:DNA (cytosine-5)-methyltransferase 1